MEKLINWLFAYKGRMGRLELFLITFFWLLIYDLLASCIAIYNGHFSLMETVPKLSNDEFVLTIFVVALAAASIIMAMIARIHDLGGSAWWLLISIIPVIGPIYYASLFFITGEAEENQYGPVPKEPEWPT